VNHLAEDIPDLDTRTAFLAQAATRWPAVSPPTLRVVAKQAAAGLTAREREVAVLIAQGRSNREIAHRLVLSERTVQTHITNILAKLRFNSRTQIATWAVSNLLTGAGRAGGQP
jgi:DNA-binding NarL/FixJ family response regulator